MIDATEFFSTAREREMIRRKREAGEPPPWTDDPIFQRYRFTNVHREHDKTTAWFRENVRDHLVGWRVVQATAIFRWFNRIEVGERIKPLLLGSWNGKRAIKLLQGVKPVTNGAYMVNSPPGYPKLEGLIECVEGVRKPLRQMCAKWGESLEDSWRELQTLPRVGSFVAYEIVTDLRWTPVLGHAKDINTWAAAGPGCARGLGYLVGDPMVFNYNSQKDQDAMLTLMFYLLELSRESKYWPQTWEPWEMHEVEMWCCEYQKYKNGQRGKKLKRRFAIGGGNV